MDRLEQLTVAALAAWVAFLLLVAVFGSPVEEEQVRAPEFKALALAGDSPERQEWRNGMVDGTYSED